VLFFGKMFDFFFFFCRAMSDNSSQHRVRQKTEEARAASSAKVENMQVIPKRNVLRADVMVAPLDFIVDIMRENHWGYLFNCACTVYPRLVREFYGYLEVVQGEDHGIILQTYIQGHMLQIDPHVM
jgi:hypothetical protein